MRKSSPRTQIYRKTSSSNAERLATFRQQMADYARGRRLLELREQKHESQENVAFAVGVSAKTLREWEHGGKIRWENAKKLGAFYKVDPEGLVSREDPGASANGDLNVTQHEPGGDVSERLERIEGQVSEIREALLGDERDAQIVAGLAARLLRVVASPQPEADEPPEIRPADEPRESA